MKTVIIILGFLFYINSYSQVDSKLLKNDLAEHIYNDNLPLKLYTIDKIKENIKIYGIFHFKTKENLTNGLYGFSMFSSHSRVYFLIIESDKFKILNVSTRTNLDISLKELLDFCERQKYCYKITMEYMNNLTTAYYKINKSPLQRIDANCESGVKKTKDLP